MTIECVCGFTCGTEQAFARHVERTQSDGRAHRSVVSTVEHLSDIITYANEAQDADAEEDTLAQTLIQACREGNATIVRECLTAGANPDGIVGQSGDQFVNITATNASFVAMRHGHADVLRLLLESRASVIVGSESNAMRLQQRADYGQHADYGSVFQAISHGRLRMANDLLHRLRLHPVTARRRSGISIGPRKEYAAGAMYGQHIEWLMQDLAVDGKVHRRGHGPACTLAMLVAEGHLANAEPSGFKGLSLRLARKPSNPLASRLKAVADYQVHRERLHSSSTLLRDQIAILLANGARPCWRPEAHRTYPAEFRAQAFAVLLCAQRLGDDDGAAGTEEVQPLVAAAPLGKLPKEVLLILIEWLAEVKYWSFEA